ncbi:MAG: lysophospholipid acyltransferase family protein [Acidobacteriia bacterium]|nr:lysophospholipid acyltransferase family protein [Terriglobia bacterium]
MFRALVTLIGVGLYILLTGPFSLLITWIFGTDHFLYSVARVGARLALRLSGGTLSIEGQENLQPRQNYIFMPNHESNVDPVAVFLAIPHDVKAIAKKEFFRVPLLNMACRLEHFISVDRQNHESAVESVEQAVKQLEAGDSFLIYPEGTRTRTGALGAFRKGGFIAAIRSKVPIVPMTVEGCYEMMRKGEFKIVPGKITVTFHKPIDPSHLTLEDRDTLILKVRNAIVAGLKEDMASNGAVSSTGAETTELT